jgi:hypothetical protein
MKRCLLEAFCRPYRDSCYCKPAYPALKRWAIFRICVVRIGEHYRALGLREGDIIAWFWIGTHEEYNRFEGSARV